MIERRKFLRFNTDIDMEYRICREKEMSGVSYIKDLSREGMRFSISQKLNRGTLLYMKFLLPGDLSPIYLMGEVIWANESDKKIELEYIVGIRFSKIDSLDRVRLLDYAYTKWLKSSKTNQ